MSSPNKTSIAARVPRQVCSPEQACRAQRRKLARRHRVSTELRAQLIPDSQADRAGGWRYDQSTLAGAETFIEKGDRRETFLRATIEACAANVAVLDEAGNILYVSKPWRLAMENHCLPSGRDPLDLNYLERWDNSNTAFGKAAALAEDIQDILNGKVTDFHYEYRCPTLAGLRWFMVHATRLALPGPTNLFRVLVNSEDTTRTRRAEEALRDLSGRLITAQEEERSRIARELHDDLNQRMALLSIELEQLSQTIPPGQDNFRQSIQNMWARAQDISSEIHRVSYQLHPAKLDHLGLVAAVRSLCLELTELHEIKIAFKENGCSGVLPKDVTLCLFRMIQESVRNVIKHSNAREAKVVLTRNAQVIQLSVSDNGRGFDVGAAESKNGLGLISMRERLRLIDGTISIHSSARGTKIEVSVPIVPANIRAAEMP